MSTSNTFIQNTPKTYLQMVIWVFLIAFAGKFVLRDAIPYFGFNPDTFGHYWDYRWSLIGHISGGLLAITIGPFQFWKGFRTKYVKVHRALGAIYIAAILIGAISATYLSWTSALSTHWTWAVSLQGLAFAWFCTVLMAFRAVRLHRYTIHKEWMIRSYVVTFGFVLFRWLNELAAGYDLGTFVERAPTIGWVCWVFPLFITEMVLQWNKKN